MIEFTIPMRTPTLNAWQRMHWRSRKRMAERIAVEVACTVPWALRPKEPLQRVDIVLERESTTCPDYDGLVGGMKPLLDVLQPRCARHPHGLGFIADDSPKCINNIIVRHVQGKRARTRVIINTTGDV